MGPRTLCQSGEMELIKGGVHGAAFVLGALMMAYNVTAWCFRRERHLMVNVLLYGPFTYIEWRQMQRHLRGVNRGDR